MSSTLQVKKVRLVKGTGAQIAAATGILPTDLVIQTDAPELQEQLVSGTNIKTINDVSLLGGGNIEIQAGATALSGLSDVTLSSPASGQFLSYNGTKWVNNSLQTTLSSSSTDNQVPSAKCVYDLVGNIETLLAAI